MPTVGFRPLKPPFLVHPTPNREPTQTCGRGGQDKDEPGAGPAPEHPAQQAPDGTTGAEAQATVEGLSATLGVTSEVMVHEMDRGGMKGGEGGRMQGLGEELNRRIIDEAAGQQPAHYGKAQAG